MISSGAERGVADRERGTEQGKHLAKDRGTDDKGEEKSSSESSLG